jgi:hypothetical protein
MNTYAVWSGPLRNTPGTGNTSKDMSCKLTWKVYFPVSQDYTFELTADNYGELYVDDTRIVYTTSSDENAWLLISTVVKRITAGWHTVTVNGVNYGTGGPAGIGGRITYLKQILTSVTSVSETFTSEITEVWTTLSEINPLSEPKFYTPLNDLDQLSYSSGLLNLSYKLAISSNIRAYTSNRWANPFPGPAPTTRGWTGTDFNTIPAGTSGYYVLGKLRYFYFYPESYCVVINGVIVYGPSSSPPPDSIAKAQSYSGQYIYASRVMSDDSEWDWAYAYDFYTPIKNTIGSDTFTWNVYFPTSGNYHIQLTLDDYGIMKIDNFTMVDLSKSQVSNWNSINSRTVKLTAGYHTITIQNTNLGGAGGVAARIYSGSTATGIPLWTTRDNYNVNSVETVTGINEWKPIEEVKVKQNGQWLTIPNVYVKRNSAWVKVFGNEKPTYTSISGLMNNTSGAMYPPFAPPPIPNVEYNYQGVTTGYGSSDVF